MDKDGLDFNNCVYTKSKDGETMIGGYTVDSILTHYPPMNSNTNSDNSNTNSNTNSKQKGGHFANMFKDLAVPAGLLFIQQTYKPNKDTFKTINDNVNHIQDSVYDKLLELVTPNERKNYNIKSRKREKKRKVSKKTRSRIK
tara:strand:+ start:3346 stop:3771 length:426 start_codon:yes stop_codon:yes gene_type:complete